MSGSPSSTIRTRKNVLTLGQRFCVSPFSRRDLILFTDCLTFRKQYAEERKDEQRQQRFGELDRAERSSFDFVCARHCCEGRSRESGREWQIAPRQNLRNRRRNSEWITCSETTSRLLAPNFQSETSSGVERNLIRSTTSLSPNLFNRCKGRSRIGLAPNVYCRFPKPVGGCASVGHVQFSSLLQTFRSPRGRRETSRPKRPWLPLSH